MTISIKSLVGFIIAALFLWLALRQVNLLEAAAALKQAHLPWLICAVIALLLDYLIRSYRWLLILRSFNPKLSLSMCAAPFWGSFAVNNILPLRAGDALRIMGYKQQLDVSRTHIASSLIIERIYDLTALLTVLVIALLVLPLQGDIAQLQQITMAGSGLSVIGIVITLFYPEKILHLLDKIPNANLQRPSLNKALMLFSNLLSGLITINKRSSCIKLILFTTSAWALEGLVFISVLTSLNIPSALYAGWLAMGAGTLSTLIPSSPGYAGTFDYFTALSLRAFEVPPSLAIVAAIVIHLILWLPITFIGGLLLWRSHGYQRLQSLKNTKGHHEL